ncbi:hypothetical protein AVEN_150744-1 [Araneus ventricosus]|uniref:Uncharacterized protein n=1 Tax=Araneus ventricosus TaxID=182803 RepID=A0A4Y2N4D9_ARAVE|nr:hypothetical protein AVEN_150744-1 [Araneus ventricosus]
MPSRDNMEDGVRHPSQVPTTSTRWPKTWSSVILVKVYPFKIGQFCALVAVACFKLSSWLLYLSELIVWFVIDDALPTPPESEQNFLEIDINHWSG